MNWPNGSSLVQTYMRSLEPISNGTLFPAVPDTQTFINLGLNTRPTFFGCDSTNFTRTNGASIPPLVVYLPNYPYVTYSNQPTISPTTNNTYRDAMIANGYEVATMANGTLAGYENWSQCVGCAILSRSFDRTGTTVPEACRRCFQQYCWDGTINRTEPATYNPSPKLQTLKVDSGASSISVGGRVLSLGIVAAICFTL